MSSVCVHVTIVTSIYYPLSNRFLLHQTWLFLLRKKIIIMLYYTSLSFTVANLKWQECEEMIHTLTIRKPSRSKGASVIWSEKKPSTKSLLRPVKKQFLFYYPLTVRSHTEQWAQFNIQFLIFTARKRSLEQGNIFATWAHRPGQVHRPGRHTPSGQVHPPSYWNAFLFPSGNTCHHRIFLVHLCE